MTKIEREILSKKISALAKQYKYLWQNLKEQIADYGYQRYYPAQSNFEKQIDNLVEKLETSDKIILVNEWKMQEQRVQFESDEKYLSQYKLFVMEELVNRAVKVAYR